MEVDIQVVLQPLGSCQVSLHNESGQSQAIVNYVSYIVHLDERMKIWQEEDKDLVIKFLSEKSDRNHRM